MASPQAREPEEAASQADTRKRPPKGDASIGGESRVDAQTRQKSNKKQKFIYGNYHRYYGYRVGDHVSADPRMKLMRREWFQDKECLDIGCNEGAVTIFVAQNFNVKRILGIDIDPELIREARKRLGQAARAAVASGVAHAGLAQPQAVSPFEDALSVCGEPASAGPEKGAEETVAAAEPLERGLRQGGEAEGGGPCSGEAEEAACLGQTSGDGRGEDSRVDPGPSCAAALQGVNGEPGGASGVPGGVSGEAGSANGEPRGAGRVPGGVMEEPGGASAVPGGLKEEPGGDSLCSKAQCIAGTGEQDSPALPTARTQVDSGACSGDVRGHAHSGLSPQGNGLHDEEGGSTASEPRNRKIKEEQGASWLSGSCEHGTASTLKGRELLKRVHFMHGNILAARFVECQFDVVLCLSVTKWVHLNWGDRGLLDLFRAIYNVLRKGGMLVLEPQPWKSYTKNRTVSEVARKNFDNIRVHPDEFRALLLEQIGFERCVNLESSNSLKEGFKRPLYLVYK